MKIMMVTTPNGEQRTIFPPIGALGVMNYARKRTPHDFKFYNIDFFRPTKAEMLWEIEAYQPDIFAVSAVISTSYAFTKMIAAEVKALFPSILIVVGGNLCASAELLLKHAHVDLCVLGEGEVTFLKIIEQAAQVNTASNFADISGLMLLGKDGDLINTGYEAPLPANEIWDVDWADLERDGSFDYYFPLLNKKASYKQSYATANKNYQYIAGDPLARQGYLTVAKGCVARCTFCHRWDKGIRHIPVDEVMRRLRHLYEKYHVRYFSMIAETFGSDKRWLAALLEEIEKYRIVWGAGGVRTSAVTPELIEQMKSTGCSSLIYGNETGSRKMLELMEKKVTLEDNYNAAQWTVEANLGNIVQLVIGMPGESPETILETIEYCKFATSLSPQQDPRQISINYAQALPGTPLYEYARVHGYFGDPGLDSEERYLLQISNREAADPQTFINFTDFPRAVVLSWNLLIKLDVRCNYLNKFGPTHYFGWIAKGAPTSKPYLMAQANIARSGKPGAGFFFYLLSRLNAADLLAWYPQLFYSLRGMAPFLSLLQVARQYDISEGWLLIKDFISHKVKKRMNRNIESISLRKIVGHEKKQMNFHDDPMMIPLRKGR